MSGIVQNNILRSSGTIAAAASGINWVSTVVTASTLTAEAGNGYFINTTSNACTITLPGSAEAGDQIVFMDYLRTWGTNAVTLDQGSLKYQAGDTNPVYDTAGETVNIVYSGATNGWIPLDDDAVTDAPVDTSQTQKAIFGFGTTGGTGYQNVTNLVTSSGVVGSDVSGVGTARRNASACGYGYDKAIFIGGYGGATTGISNLVNNVGVVASDTAAVALARNLGAGVSYGNDKGIFCFGSLAPTGSGNTGISNLISSAGVVASDTAAVATAKDSGNDGGCQYGVDKAIVAYGHVGSVTNSKNLISNVGIVASDASGVGTARSAMSATSYSGNNLGIFAFGDGPLTTTNLISSTGVQASDSATSASAKYAGPGAPYGGDKALFAYGHNGSTFINERNLISSSGVTAANVSGAGTARYQLPGAGYSQSA